MEENNQTSTQTTFKTHLNSEKVKENYIQVTQLNLKGSRVMHNLGFEYLERSMDRTPIDSRRFFKPLDHLKRINHLTVSLQQSEEEEIIAKVFSEKLRSLSSLQSLKLQFDPAGWISREGMMHLANALGDLKRLSKLTLTFEALRFKCNDEYLHILFQGLRKHKNLKSFDLIMGYPAFITEKNLQEPGFTS